MKHRYLAGVAIFALAAGINSASRAQVSTSGDVTLDEPQPGTATTTVGSAANPGTLTIDGTSPTTYATGFVDIAPSVPTATGTSYVYVQNGGVLTAGGIGNIGIIVGDGGAGTFNQTSGGLVTSGVGGTQRADVIIGAQAGSTGIYNLGLTGQTAAPTLQVFGDIVLGRDDSTTSPSALPQSNGTLNIAGDGTALSVNQYMGYDSHYGGNLQVGVNGVGAVTQTDASTVYLDHNLVLGANSNTADNASGTYTLTATSVAATPNPGIPSTYNLFVGSDLNVGGMQTDAYGSNFQTTVNGGTGTFNLNSGDVYVVGNVNVGNNDGTGNLNVSGGTLTAGVGMNVGYNTGPNGFSMTGGGTGTVTQTGGAVTVGNSTTGSPYNSFQLGVTNDPSAMDTTTGNYSITGNSSTLTIYSNADVGVTPGGTGVLTIGNGTDTPTVNIVTTSAANNDGNLTIGDAGNGTLNMNSGTLNVLTNIGGVNFGNIQIGVNGTGTVNQSGGAISADFVYLSTPAGSGTSTYTMTGGSLTTTADLDVGGAGTGFAEFNQSAGTVNVGGALQVGQNDGGSSYAAYNFGGSAMLNLSGDLIIGSQSNQVGVFDYNSFSGDSGVLTFTGTGQHLVVGDAGTAGLYIGSTVHAADLNLQTNSTTLLDIGRSQTGIGSITLFAGSSLEDNGVTVGDAGTGQIYNYGTHTVGTTTAPANLVVGSQSTGSGYLFDYAGATTNVYGELVVGAGGTGSYDLGDGVGAATLNVNGTGLQGDVYVGETGTGTILAQSGSTAVVQGVLVLGGSSPGETTGNGTLTVTGGGTSWTNQSQAQVGGSGTGYLNVYSGGYFESDPGGGNPSPSGTSGVIGAEAGSNGYATVDGTSDGTPTGTPSEWYNGGALRVGGGGTGTLTISNNGLVVDNAATGSNGVAASVGYLVNSTGTVNIESNGTWTNNGNLNVGDAGKGTVNFVDGTGTVNVDGNLDLGTQSTGNGTFNLNNGTLNSNETYVGDAGTGLFANTGGNHTVTGDVILGNQGGSAGTYDLTAGGTLTVSGFTTVGGQGQGTFLNDDSTHDTQVLVVGVNSPSTAGSLYTLQNGGALTVGSASNTGFADIGEYGTGTFTQTGSSTSLIYGALDVGRFAGGTGTLNLEGGSIEVADGFAVVGDSGTGYVYQSGGSTLTVDSGGLAIGRGESNADTSVNCPPTCSTPISGTGTYTLSDTAQLKVTGGITLGSWVGNHGYFVQTGGVVNADTEYVGLAGVGDWNQSGGTNTASSSLVIGNNTGGTGTYELSGDPTTVVLNGGEEYIGAAGNGTLTQTGGTNNATYLSIANNAGGVGLYTLSAGTLDNTGDTYLGGDTGAQGTFTQTGGKATLGGNVDVGFAASTLVSAFSVGGTGSLSIGGNLTVGDQAMSLGTFNFNTASGDAATVNFTGGSGVLTVGYQGTGVFNQGGGDLNLYGEGVGLVLGDQPFSSGTYNLTGGTLEDDLIVGKFGTGVFNNSGGVHTVNGNLLVGDLDGGNGTYTLSGTGNLTLATASASVILGDAQGATGTFNYNTVTPSTDSGKITFGSGQSITVGGSGTGYFNQGAGDLNLYGAGVSLDIAQKSTSSGAYDLTGGSLETGALYVGDGGVGTFTNSGGTHNAYVELVVGEQSNPDSSYYVLNGTGSLALQDGADLILGDQVGSHGELDFNDTNPLTDKATITFNGSGQSIIVGNYGNGVVIQGAGDVNLYRTGGALIVPLVLGENTGSSGTYTISGGTLETGPLNVGNGGSGAFTVRGTGSATVNGDLVVGNQANTFGSGVSIIEGGNLTVTGNATVGNNAYGYLDIGEGVAATGLVDIQGSLTIGATSAGGAVTVNDASLSVGGNLTISQYASMAIQDDTVTGAQVTVGGTLTNNNTLELGLHDIMAPGKVATLTVADGFINNGSFNFIANSVLNANVTNTNYFTAQNGPSTNVTLNGNVDNVGTHALLAEFNVSPLGGGGSTLTQNGNFKNEAYGLINVDGSTLTINGAGGGPALDNYGAVSIFYNGEASNVTVNGATINEAGGTIGVSNSVATWNGTFTNNGAYNADPGSLNVFVDLDNGPTGYLTGTALDTFQVKGNFLSTSTQNTKWSTAASTLQFSGPNNTTHTVQLTGQDVGAIAAGYTNNFAWGVLKIDTGNTLSLLGTVGVNALYVGSLTGLDFGSNPLDITNIFGNGLNIYYNPSLDPALGDKVYDLANGGLLDPIGSVSPGVPEPSTWALMILGFSGLATLAGLKRRRDAREAASQAS